MNKKIKAGIQELKEFELHKEVGLHNNKAIMRVPGVIIYTIHQYNTDEIVAAVFVPFPKEAGDD